MSRDLLQKLLRHLRFLELELADTGHFADLTREEYLKDSDRRRNVERWAENIINSTIDVAKIALTLERLPLGDSYREIVASLSVVGEFASIDVSEISGWTRLRNVLAHEYLDLRWRSLERFIQDAPARCGSFLECTKRYLSRVGGGST